MPTDQLGQLGGSKKIHRVGISSEKEDKNYLMIQINIKRTQSQMCTENKNKRKQQQQQNIWLCAFVLTLNVDLFFK